MRCSFITILSLVLNSTAIRSQIPQQYDIIIDEVMADPTPAVGLPVAEYIEIKNTSGHSINLSGWKFKSSTSSSGTFSNYVLPADSFLIICSNANASLLQMHGKLLAVSSFPSLDNDGTMLSLISKEGRTIHAVAYQNSWHDDDKKDGGWSLEMMDTNNPCAGKNNWKSSVDSSGGSPGRKNSIDGINADETPPRLLKTYSTDSLTIMAVFDEPVDSLAAALVSNYTLTHNISIISAQPQSGLLDHVRIKLSMPMQKGIVYTLSANRIKDCKGNNIGIYNHAKAGVAEDIWPGDVIVNEILFNPRPGAFDYVELYNRSKKIIDASQLFIAGKNSSGIISQSKKISEKPFLIFPGEYIVVTKDEVSLQHEYLVKNPEQIITISAFPSYPDDKGTIVVLDAQGSTTDELTYSNKWHFALISNDDGIALERIDPASPTQDQNNWHSAASSVGFGTPTYQNSQYRQMDQLHASVEITPKLFSPDNDGLDDFAMINYEVEESGYVANVSIFSANGKLMARLVKNELLGLKGGWKWEGLDENKNRLPAGVYIIYTELFNLHGKKKSFKNVITLAKKLN